MAENYKHLYEQTKKMLVMYQDELVPGFRQKIEELEQKSKWIPVTERLPENIGLFLVIEKHWIDGSPCRRIAKWNTEDWFTADRKSKEITPRVTHWMPLPEPPKEVE